MTINNSKSINIYKTMLLIRFFEEKICEVYKNQKMKTPVHLCIGQEAISAAVNENLKKQDRVFSTHRAHGHYIAHGGNLLKLMAELYGRKTGCSGGKGGSMHIIDLDANFFGTSAIVGGIIPIAVGSALKSSYKNDKAVTVCYLGDAATEEGVFYESINFAVLKKLPIIFICENNFYATNSYLINRQPLDNIYKKVKNFGIESFRVNGNQPDKIYLILKEYIEKVRRRNKILFLECRTYRWFGHVGPVNDCETGCRPKDELDFWKKKCPIGYWEKILKQKKILSEENIFKIKKILRKKVEQAHTYGINQPFPGKKDLLRNIY